MKKKILGKPKLYGLLNPNVYKLENCSEASRSDRCVDYEAFLEVAITLYNRVTELKQQTNLHTLRVWSSYLGLTLVMLINGLRVREALRAITRFYESGDRRIVLEAVKKGDKRLVIIPEFVQREDLEYIYKKLIRLGEEKVRKSFLEWLKAVFKVNPHSLRYAFIRYHTLTGRTPQEIAKALGIIETKTIKKYYLRGLPT